MRIDLLQSWRRSSRASVALAVAYLALCSLAIALVPAEAKAGKIQIDAWMFDRGNASVIANPDIYADYRDKYAELVLGDGGKQPWMVEYDVDFPADGEYTLHVRYGSPGNRPLELLVDGRSVGKLCGRATGNGPPFLDRHPRHDRPRHTPNFHGLEWEETLKFSVTKGKRTLRFTRKGPPPRLCVLRLDTPTAFPKGYKPTKREMKLDRVPAPWRRWFLPAGHVNVGALRLAIENVTAEFGPKYPKGPQYLKQLAELDKKQRSAQDATPEQKQKIEDALQSLQHEAMLAHPRLKFERLLFVKQMHRGVSIYTGHRSNGQGGGNLCVLSPVSAGGKVTELVPELSGGVFGRFDLSFDAKKVVFCYCKEGGQYRIYEIDIAPLTGLRAKGKSLRQITFKTDDEVKAFQRYVGSFCGTGYDDIDPCYLPDGKIMFGSTRAQRAVLCAPQTATTLHVMDADGKNMRCISSGQVNELSPCLMDDGQVIYTRWEYVDKGFGNAQSLWSVRPDGSGSDHVYKNMVVRPGSMVHSRSIPNSARFVTVGVGHHGGLAGPIIVVDNQLDRRNPGRMTNITPEISLPGLFPMGSRSGCFREPYPLSEKLFLTSHKPTIVSHIPKPKPDPKAKAKTKAEKEAGKPRFGLYLLDAWGNRAKLYSDPKISCLEPMPLRARPRPGMITPVADIVAKGIAKKTAEQGLATMFMLDVYQGMTGIERGRVKYIRVMEAMNLSWLDAWRAGKQGDGAGMQASAVSGDGDVAIKKVHGIATVHADGSACFTVPAEENIFLQALDENYMELQRMRTFLNLMPGESRSCVGCHEFRSKAPNRANVLPQAMTRPIQTLRPQPGDTGPRRVHYAVDVQTTLDRHCIGCHGGKTPKGDLDLTGELTLKFNQSYNTLKKKKLVSYLEGGFGSANVPAEPPLTFGSHQSKLVERIRKDPCKSKLTREEFIRIVTWIDANAPYYGTHRGKKNLKWKDEPDFRPIPLAVK